MIVKQLDHPAGQVYRTCGDCARAVWRLFPWLSPLHKALLVMQNQGVSYSTVRQIALWNNLDTRGLATRRNLRKYEWRDATT